MADKKLPIAVVITAVDNVTAKMADINKKIALKFEPLGKLQTAFKNLGEEAGIGKLGKALSKVGKTGGEFFTSLKDSAVKIATVGATIGGALYGIAHSFADSGDEIGSTAARLGLTTDAYQELAFAANQANVPQEQFNSAMQKFSKGIGEAAAGTGEAFVGFNALGISVRDSHGKIKSLEQLLPQVADKLKGVQNQSLRNAIASKIFGKEGAKLNDIFNEGSAGLAKLRQEAHRVGAVMTPEQIKAAQDFDDGMKSVMATLMSVRNVIGAALAPVLLDLGKALQSFVLDHQEEIKAFATAFAAKLPGILENLYQVFQKLVSALQPVVIAFNVLSAIFGTTTVASFALFAYLGGPAVINMLKFAGALSGVIVPAIRTAYVVFGLLWGVISSIAAALFALVGWPGIIAAAFVGAAFLIWKHWEPIKAFFESIGDKISGFFGGGASLTQNLNQNSTMAPALGFGQTVDNSKRSTENKSVNEVKVSFDNLPTGTRVEKTKDEGNMDLSMGYSGVGAGA